MKKHLLLGVLATGLVVGGISLTLRPRETKVEAKDASIIVKLDNGVSKKAMLNKIRNIVTPNIEVENEYSLAFNGFTIAVPSQYVSDIRYLSGVKDVNYNIVLAEQTLGDGVAYPMSESVVDITASTTTMEKPEGTNDGSGTFVAILDNAFYLHYLENGVAEFHEVYSPLNSVDATLSEDDVKALIDGAENFHGKYDEENSTYFNNKVPFYYDYGGDSSGRATPDYDVYDQGQDHGTHVSSLAAGNAGKNYQGIAPKAQLALMKVFSTYMEGQEYKSRLFSDALLAALEDCIALKVDVINMSLGSDLDDFDDQDILQETIRNLEAAGTFVCVAAGNSGKGEWDGRALEYWGTDMVETNIISSYANNMAAMTVASTQADTQFYGSALLVDGKNIKYSDEVTNYKSTSGDVVYNPERYLSDLIKDYETDEFDFVFVPGLGEVSDYANIDVTGKIAVIDRGTVTFEDKVKNAYAAGAIAALIVNNEESVTEFNIRMSFGSYSPEIPVCFILNGDRDSFAKSATHKLSVVQNKELDNPDTRTISPYSSDGMRYDLSIKPEISAPGQNVKGAVLGNTQAYESMSGTSMATPNFAGAVALMISNHLGDDDYRATINSRLMSTASPMLEADKVTHASVRRQGAGLVNLTSAVKSEVYLDGVDSEGNQLGKAKIELKNNDDIKQGNINLKFAAINESNEAKTYTATTYVYAPALAEYTEGYEGLTGTKFQAIQDYLLETFTENVTIAPGTSTITLTNRSLSDKSKEYLTQFDYGSIIEGYVVLTAEDEYQLSVPFLGYYGNLEDASPVEPFTFEREEGRVYTSDTMNYFLKVSLLSDDYRKADFNSMMLAGYYPNYKNFKFDDVINNKTALNLLSDSNSNPLKSVTMNPYTGLYDKENIFMGNGGYSNTLVIQQYVIRSVNTNTVTITKKSNGEVVGTNHLEDSLFGPAYDVNPTMPTAWPLYKSHFDYDTLYELGYMAHRAIGVVPVYSLDSKKNIVPYEDGEYELKFTYELAAGSTFTKTYNLTINSDLPTVTGREKVSEGGKDYMRFHYADESLRLVTINGVNYAPTAEAKGYYVDVDLGSSAFAKDDTVYVTSENLAYAKDGFLTKLNDENMVMIRHNLMNSEYYSYDYTVAGKGTGTQTFTFSFTKGGSDYNPKGDVSYTMLIPEGVDADSLKLYTVNASGSEKEIKFTKDGDFISFSSTLRTFKFASNGQGGGGEGGGGEGGDTPGPDQPVTPSKGCGGSIAATSIILSTTALLGVVLLALKKRKDN